MSAVLTLNDFFITTTLADLRQTHAIVAYSSTREGAN
jgi:hypothetical protein